MNEEMQKTGKGCHTEVVAESRGIYGVQACMGKIENNLVEVSIWSVHHAMSNSNLYCAGYHRLMDSY